MRPGLIQRLRKELQEQHYLDQRLVQRAVDAAVQAAGIRTDDLPHPPLFVRHAPPWSSRPIRAIQELLGHSDVEITMVYTHALPEDYLGYEAPPICTEERRDLLRAA